MNKNVQLSIVYSSPEAFDATLKTLVDCVNEEFDELCHALADLEQQIVVAEELTEQHRLLALWNQYNAVHQVYQERMIIIAERTVESTWKMRHPMKINHESEQQNLVLDRGTVCSLWSQKSYSLQNERNDHVF